MKIIEKREVTEYFRFTDKIKRHMVELVHVSGFYYVLVNGIDSGYETENMGAAFCAFEDEISYLAR